MVPGRRFFRRHCTRTRGCCSRRCRTPPPACASNAWKLVARCTPSSIHLPAAVSRIVAPWPRTCAGRPLPGSWRRNRGTGCAAIFTPRHPKGESFMDNEAHVYRQTGTSTFPADFVWGAATAAYQVEGATHEDGRGESIWDRFCWTPGKVRNDDSGDIACDHYHRYQEDVGLMRWLGLTGYRFSVAWPRILPQGTGRVNDKGLDFYDRLVDELLAAGVEPFATLYHWDLPQVLEDRGGWLDRGTAEAFGRYTEVVVRRLGDRVRHWTTLNEPQVAAWAGYGAGVHAPGRTGDANAVPAGHHLLLAHGRAVEIIRGECPDATVGITLNLTPIYPASEAEPDLAAARLADSRGNRWFLDPVFRGSYPEEAVRQLRGYLPERYGEDMPVIAAPIDFLGVNYYTRRIVRAGAETGRPIDVRPEGSTFTTMDWEIYPDGLRELLLRLHREYAPRRMYITENGASFEDV